MENEDIIRHIENWIASARRVEATFGKIEQAFMAAPENEIRSSIWGMHARYTDTLADLIGGDRNDVESWLFWFAWECDFGAKPANMVFSSGKTQTVTTAAQLLAAIQDDDSAID
jgi:hypothetical protein